MMKENTSQYLVRLFGDKNYQRVGGEDCDLAPGGKRLRVESIKRFEPLSLVQPLSDMRMTNSTPSVAELQGKPVRRKPVAR